MAEIVVFKIKSLKALFWKLLKGKIMKHSLRKCSETLICLSVTCFSSSELFTESNSQIIIFLWKLTFCTVWYRKHHNLINRKVGHVEVIFYHVIKGTVYQVYQSLSCSCLKKYSASQTLKCKRFLRKHVPWMVSCVPRIMTLCTSISYSFCKYVFFSHLFTVFRHTHLMHSPQLSPLIT